MWVNRKVQVRKDEKLKYRGAEDKQEDNMNAIMKTQGAISP